MFAQCSPSIGRAKRLGGALLASFILICCQVVPVPAQCRTTLDVDSYNEVYYSLADTLTSIQLNPLVFSAPALLEPAVGFAESSQSGCGNAHFLGIPVAGPDESYDLTLTLQAGGNYLNDFLHNGIRFNGITTPLNGLNIVPCDRLVRTSPHALTHLGGDANAYAFHIGAGPYLRKIRKVTYQTCRNMVIENNSTSPIEMVVTTSGGVFAAESFGNPDKTFGKAKMEVSGTIAGHSVSAKIPETSNDPEGFLVSESVLPEEAGATLSRRVTVLSGTGSLGFQINLRATAEVRVQAKSVGLYGLLAGSATAGVSFPTSFDFSSFTGPNGTPLPPGVKIYDADDGSVYADTRVFPGQPNFLTTTTLRRDSQSNEILADVTLTNIGPGEARSVQLTTAKLGATFSTTTAQSIGRLIPELPAGQATRTFRFPASAGTSGAPLLLQVRGNYAGGVFGGDVQVSLP